MCQLYSLGPQSVLRPRVGQKNELRQIVKPILLQVKKSFAEHDESYKPLAGRTMAMIFTKPSMRTRISFETVRDACQDLPPYARSFIQYFVAFVFLGLGLMHVEILGCERRPLFTPKT